MRHATLFASLLVLGVPRDVHGQSVDARLEVTRSPSASSCPDARALASATSRLAGRRVISDEGTDRVNVTFWSEGGRFRAVLIARSDPSASRELTDDGTTCEALGDAVALSLVVLLDPTAGHAPASAPRIEPAPTIASPAQGIRRQVAAPSAPSAPSAAGDWSGWWFSVRGGAGGAYGVLDGLTPLVWAGVTVNTPSWLGFALEAAWLPNETTTFPPGRVHARLIAGSGGLCVRPLALAGAGADRGRIRLDACGTINAGSLRVEGEGFAKNSAASRAYFAVGLNANFGVAVTDAVEASLRVAGTAPLRRDSFFIDGAGDVFRPDFAGLFVGLGLGVSFR